MNALFAPGAKRNRFMVAFGLTLLLAAPAMMLWAGKAQNVDTGDDSRMEQTLLKDEARRVAGVGVPEATYPPAEFSPFGGVLKPREIRGAAAADLLAAPVLGDIAWDPTADDVTASLKPGMRWGQSDMTKVEHGHLRPGLNFVRISQAAMDANADAAMRTLGEQAQVIYAMPRSTFMVNVEAKNMHLLRKNPDLDRMRPVEPGMKVSPTLGARPEIKRSNATDPQIRAWVALVPGISTADAARSIAQMPGVSNVTENLFGGQLRLQVHYTQIGKLAQRDDILSIYNDYDHMLTNDESVPTTQAGSAEDANFLRPFDMAGVDGGGIDTNADGRRINNGTDAVPPQIVTIVDNGISADTPNFSQTATQVAIPITAPIGPLHRKIHNIQNAGDSGTSCDAQLSGAGTHGNVVAAAIGAFPSQLGFFVSRAGVGGPTQPRNENLDGMARGARILMEDAATTAVCTLNSLVERGGNVSPGSLTDRLNAAICPIVVPGAGACNVVGVGGGTETHLAVLPFGAPSNFGTNQFLSDNGTYTNESNQLDTFLYNNRDFMIFSPVGNNGGIIGTNRLALALREIPDLFNGSALDEDPNVPKPIQTASPATAKNIVSVGGSTGDCITFFAPGDCEGSLVAYTSRGPATPQSLRMAPIVTAPQFDLVQTPYTATVAVFRSNDNDNVVPIDAQLDEGNFGTSYAAAYITGAGAIIRDYFAQGFYPTGSRVDTDRTPNLSGAFIKAALAASADFNEGGIATQGQDNNERDLRRTRALNLGTVTGVLGSVNVGIMGNSEQGYGRPVLTDVLPLANWPDNFVLHPNSGSPIEYPAAGLLAFDRYATGEPLITNAVGGSPVTHTFRVAGSDLFTTGVGAVVLRRSQLRIALAWPDLPSPAGAGGPLINDLDLIVESPGPDNCLTAADTKPDGSACPAGAATDNILYDGNNYDGGRNNAIFDQWSRGRGANPEIHDFRNPIEAVHLVGDSNFDGNFADSTLFIGRWRATVQRGRVGGLGANAFANLVINGAINEDTNNNGRLDTGEDANANGLLDQPGQPYALVVSGPVFLAEANPPAGPTNYPQSQVSFDASRYGCASNAVLNILDTTGTATPANVKGGVTFQVLDANGVVVDSEANFNFTQGNPATLFASAAIPIRLAGPGVVGNGILEADTGFTIVATYNRAPQRTLSARAAVSCSPDLINAFFLTADNNNNAIADQVAINNGCDNDDNLDAGEVVTYGVALQNRSRTDNYADVLATLTPSGAGAAAVRVIDSPKNIGTFPGGGATGVFFHVFVDPAIANGLPVNSRVVTMTLTLDSLSKGRKIGRQSYNFTHALNSDRQEFYYSTDWPTGGREVRDLNRNLIIDPPDTLDPFLTFIVPDEDVTFSSLFSGTGAPATHFTNELGEDLDLNGAFSGAERDIIPNGAVDRGVLNGNVPNPALDRIPWSFDNNNGGWNAFRHPSSLPGSLPATPVWEYLQNRPVCGFQTASGAGKFGIWHAGDGNAATPSAAATACDNHAQPRDSQTTPKVEMIMDVLESPIVAKVNQNNDARGFAYTVEFQRLAFNENIQLLNAYAGGGVNIDNNVDSDNTNSLLAQQLDQYYTRRTGGWPYGVFRDGGQYFNNGDAVTGIDPSSTAPHQRTFGPFTNTNGLPFDGDETGFSGFTQNNNPASSSPIPTTEPDFLAYPLPGAPVAGICDGGTNNDQPCAVNADCGGGNCRLADNTPAGPVRNWDASLVDYEGGWASLLDPAPTENYFFFTPGKAGNRWQIGIGFWAIESTTGDTDYGKSIDDVVFEWLEWHPEDETAMGRPAACSRYNSAGNPSGGQCATITADRSTLYECDEAVEITIYDAKCISGAPLGGACTTDAQCGGGDCTADNPSVSVSVVTESDAQVVDYQGTQVFYPNSKLFTLNAVAGSPGLFRGSVIFSTTTNNASHVFTVPGNDSSFTVYYHDPLCDGDRDGQAAEDNFNNVDGDGVPDASDKCPQIYDPGQQDADGDGFGDLCDNCPTTFNDDQADASADGVGDACEFDDVDGDTIPNELDNCPDVRNINQSDIEGDGRGDLCDTLKTLGVTFGGIPTAAAGAATQCTAGACVAPAIAAGQACANDEACIRSCDTTGGVPGVCSNTGGYISPLPAVGAACTTHADCYRDIDRDGDGVLDALDNCVVGDNGPVQGPNNQVDSDGDGLGNVCDGDCQNVTETFVCRGSGNACPVPETNQPAFCLNANGLGNVCGFYLANTGGCSAANDDLDADGNSDQDDNCTTVPNPAIVANTLRQRDNDRDGLGDACDPSGTFDDAGDGIPDDVVNFAGVISCRTQPLANLTVLSAVYVDLDGDHDPFPDTAETGRVVITVRNDGVALTDATFVLSSSDPDVACITSPSLTVGAVANGATVVAGTLVAGQPGFQFTSSNSMLYTGPPQEVPQSTLCLTVVANETLGTNRPICFNLLSDLNAPPGVVQVFTKGPDGIAGSADDGTVEENFDIDKNADGVFTVADTFLENTGAGYRGTCNTAPGTPGNCSVDADCPEVSPGVPGTCYRGGYIRGDATGIGAGVVAAVTCGGYDDPLENDLCILDPDYPMDWHFHCPTGALNCPHTDTPTCVGTPACSYNTPTGGNKAHSTPNSLSMGAHFDQSDNLAGDTTHFRTLQGFQSAPVNLALFPDSRGLEMRFFHIARLMDNNGVSPGNDNQCVDCGDVQIQLDSNPDPNIDTWGTWDKLVPFQNTYDHKNQAWSVFGSYYCQFTPTDTGTAAPNPKGVHETLCYPLGAWSHCGSTIGTVATATLQCTGPGEVDPSGIGVWVETKFNLAGYLGQRVRIRWIAETWNFGAGTETYFEVGGTWAATQQDDGWWLDDIRITGTVTGQVTPEADTTPRTGTCPSDPCNQAVADAGTTVRLKATDVAGNMVDPTRHCSNNAAQSCLVNADCGGGNTCDQSLPSFSGQAIRISAIDSSIDGGCVNGVAEYEFSKNGVVVQTFGPKSFYLDAPEANTSYSARARCSSDFTCTSLVGASIDVGPYSEADGNTFFGERNSPPNMTNGVSYFRGVCTAGSAGIGAPCNAAADCGTGGACNVTASTADDVTRLRWWSPGNFGTDVIRGTVPAAAPKGTLAAPFWNLGGLGASCIASNVTGTPTTPGSNYTTSLSQAADPNPALGAVTYYDVTSNQAGGTNVNAFGCANPNVCSNNGWCELGSNAGAPCNVNADCAGGGTCLLRSSVCNSDTGTGDAGGCGRHQVCAGGTNVGRLCLAATDCPGSTCPTLAAGISTPGQVCYNLNTTPLPPPAGGCPAVGNPKRLVRRVGGGGLVCP